MEFCERIRNFDFTDQRANILFSRRMERLLDDGYEDEYLELTRKLLAQRPSNHEAWKKMGQLHEKDETNLTRHGFATIKHNPLH